VRLSLIKTAAVAVALAMAPATEAWAQLPENGAPTRAGTKIVNTATVTFTDANENAYDPVSESVELEVAFVAGVEIAATNKPQPKSPGTGNWIEYTITNLGNDDDYFQVSANAGAGITVTGFSLVHPDNAAEGDWLSLVDFNTLLAQAQQHRDYVGNNGGWDTPQGTPSENTELVFYVRFDLDPDFDPAAKLEVTATSGRDPQESDSVDAGDATLDPEYVYDVAVTAQDATQQRLPTANPADVNQQYQAVFTVENKASGSDFTWTLSVDPGANVSIVSVAGTNLTGGPTSGSLTLNNGQSVDVTVTYTVAAAAAAGTTEDLIFEVASADDDDVSDSAQTQVRVVRPSLSITKQAFQTRNGDPIAAGGVVPGATIWYRITVTNAETNGADAVDVTIEDVIPDALELLGTDEDASNTGTWSITTGTNGNGETVVTIKPVDGGNDPRPMAPGETGVFWIEVRVR